MRQPYDPAVETQLVAACLRGDEGAWERLYRCCQRSLVLSVKLILGPQARDESLVDEITARVWLWLVEDDRRLSGFDASRGRLVTYLAALARDSVQRHRRSQRRRTVREETAAGSAASNELLTSFESSLDDFLSILTPREKEFCEQYLLANPDSPSPVLYTPANLRQLRHRVLMKLQTYVQ